MSGSNTEGYCVGNIFLTVSSTVTFAFSLLLFILHMNKSGWGNIKTYKETTTYVYAFLLFYATITLLKYLLTLYVLKNYVLLINIDSLIFSLLQFCVCSIFAQRAIDQNDKATVWMKTVLNLILCAIFAIYIGLSVWQTIDSYQTSINVDCHTYSFLVSEVLNLCISVMFIAFGFYIS